MSAAIGTYIACISIAISTYIAAIVVGNIVMLLMLCRYCFTCSAAVVVSNNLPANYSIFLQISYCE